jgi:hypothetical protein
MPEDPKQELWVTLAGPAVNVVIAGVLYFVLVLRRTFSPTVTRTVTTGFFWERLMLLNVVLVLFNLIPAFPMEEGRSVRCLPCACLGRGIALLFGLLGLSAWSRWRTSMSSSLSRQRGERQRGPTGVPQHRTVLTTGMRPPEASAISVERR